MLSTFHEEHLEKFIPTSLSLVPALPMAKPTIKLKQKYNRKKPANFAK